MKDLEEEIPHECWDYYMAGLAAESALVSAQVPSLHQHRFQAGRVASLRWLACVVLPASGAMQILLAPVLLDRSARPGIGRRNFGFGPGGGAFFGGRATAAQVARNVQLCATGAPRNGRLKFHKKP
jgi:hypothetical protein